ncbi:MAG: DNA cytosine methyltransferase [Nitrospinae bacterium]|nr:DNA cytosine methyltransferase [Nitrospinota bacterium]
MPRLNIVRDNLKVVDLFSGAGGFSLGAHLAGFRTVLATDVDTDLTKNYKSNFPQARYRTADLSLVEPQGLLKVIDAKPGYVDGVLGGPPCQGFSSIGMRDPNDPRSELVRRFFHFVRHIDPAFFVMENVRGILNDPFRKMLTDCISEAIGRYQIIGPIVLEASDFGAATSRPRVFIIGCRRSRMDPISERDIRRAIVKRRTTVYEAIHDLPRIRHAERKPDGDYWGRYVREPDKGPGGEYARRARRSPPNGLAAPYVRDLHRAGKVSGFQPTNHSRAVLRRFEKLRCGDSDETSKCPRLDWEGICSTLRAGTGKDRGSYQSIRPIHPTENRVITVREAARLQGFPDWFQFHPTKWHSFRMIGNSVSPYLVCRLLGLLARRLAVSGTRDIAS